MGPVSRRVLSSLRENWVVSVGLLAVAALMIAVDPAKLGRDVANADRLVVLVVLPTVLILYLLHGVACGLPFEESARQLASVRPSPSRS